MAKKTIGGLKAAAGLIAMLLMSSLLVLVFANIGVEAIENWPSDTGNNDPVDSTWQNDNGTARWWFDDPAFQTLFDFRLNESEEFHLVGLNNESGDIELVVINENISIGNGAVLTFENCTVEMNGSSGGGEVRIQIDHEADKEPGMLVLKNSTLRCSLNLLYFKVLCQGIIILDNSTIIDHWDAPGDGSGDTFVIEGQDGGEGDDRYASLQCFNSVLDVSEIEVGVFAGMYTINTDVSACDYITLEATTGFWVDGTQHFVQYPEDTASAADVVNRTITIEDAWGNDTITYWNVEEYMGIQFEDHLHMDNHTVKGVKTFGTTKTNTTNDGNPVGPCEVVTYGITWGANGTWGINVTLDYPSTWRDNSVEIYNHTTASTVRWRNITDDSPYYECPYLGSDDDNDTGRRFMNPMWDEVTKFSSRDEFQFEMNETDSPEVNYAGIVAEAGAAVRGTLGSVVYLNGSATVINSSALTYTWSIYNPTMTRVLATYTGARIIVNLTATLYATNTTYYAVIFATNVEGSSGSDQTTITVVSATNRSSGTSGGGEDEDEEEDAYDWWPWGWLTFWSWPFWTDVWAYVWTWEFMVIAALTLVILYFAWPAFQNKVKGVAGWFTK